jgi:hypothetical protein
MTPDEIKRLDSMIEAGMQGEREVWKWDLSFTRDHIESFVEMMIKEGVAILDRLPTEK